MIDNVKISKGDYNTRKANIWWMVDLPRTRGGNYVRKLGTFSKQTAGQAGLD